MKLGISTDRWELRRAFVTSQEAVTHIETITVSLEREGFRGWGEALGVDYRGETAASMRVQLESVRAEIERGADRSTLPSLLPAGGARNAVDCALWDLEAKSRGRTIWQLLGREPRALTTAYTIGLGAPDAMAREARSRREHPLLKLKLDARQPLARLEAVRAARPDARLIVDANGAWSAELLDALDPALAALRVELVEQPLPAGADAALAGRTGRVPLCADESCQTRAELAEVAERYAVVNVKLDKTGGLSEALELVEECRRRGLTLMVGNMLGSSLAMAPAFVVGQSCAFVDLDGPLFQTRDRDHPMRYEGGVVRAPSPELWG